MFYGILTISTFGEEKPAVRFQYHLCSSGCWLGVVRVHLAHMQCGIEKSPIVPGALSTCKMLHRGLSLVRECGAGIEAFWMWERSKRG